MRIQLIQIGNSKGFRLPKKIIDQYQIQDEMELILNEQDLTLKPLKKSVKDGMKHFNKCMQMAMTNYLSTT
jgi:antitoxin MazE